MPPPAPRSVTFLVIVLLRMVKLAPELPVRMPPPAFAVVAVLPEIVLLVMLTVVVPVEMPPPPVGDVLALKVEPIMVKVPLC